MRIPITAVLAATGYLLALRITRAQTAEQPAGLGQGEAQLRASFDAYDFVADYSNLTDIGNDNGSIKSVIGTGQPALYTLPNNGLSQGVITLDSCAVWSPHYHPRASEILYVTQGALNISFAEENPVTVNETSYGGRVFNFQVKAQNSVIIPQGLLHYLFNPTCANATIVTSFDNKDPGSVSVVRELFGFAQNIISAATGLDQVAVNLAKAITLQTALIGVDKDCQAKCRSQSGGAPAAAPPAGATTLNYTAG